MIMLFCYSHFIDKVKFKGVSGLAPNFPVRSDRGGTGRDPNLTLNSGVLCQRLPCSDSYLSSSL